VNIVESTVLALRSLRTGRLRTLLTSVGIILGVAAMIVLVGVSDGMRTKFERSIGDTARTVRIVSASPDGTGTANGNRQPLRERDAEYLRENLASDALLVNPGRRGGGVVSNGTKKFRATLQGSSYRFLTTDNRKVIAGRAITKQARVAMVGYNVVKYLYDGDLRSAVGSPLRVGRQDVQIVGVLDRSNDSQDGLVVMPLSTSRKFMGGTDTVTGISVVAQTSHDVSSVNQQALSILDQFRDVFRPSARDFRTQLTDLQTNDTNRFVTLFTLFTLGIAAISLLVGGIGVANIMFIAVKERTREIGIRKAIGARQGAIVQQFLVESTLLTALGGVVGVALGVGLVLLGKALLPAVLPEFGIPVVSVPAILVSLGAAVVIGLLAGVLPAVRAARLRPIEALRHE
jgi:putative ABC transport system permease protein